MVIIGSWFEFVWGEGERIWTNFEAGPRLFDISNVPLLISYASTNINLSFEAENQADLALSFSLSLWLSAEETRRNSVPVILHGIIRTFTADPYNSLHPAGISYEAAALHTRYSPLPPVSLFTDTCSFHWHDARITEEDKPRTVKARIARKFNVLRALIIVVELWRTWLLPTVVVYLDRERIIIHLFLSLFLSFSWLNFLPLYKEKLEIPLKLFETVERLKQCRDFHRFEGEKLSWLGRERGREYTTGHEGGKRKRRRERIHDESVLQSFASSLRGRIDTKFLSNRRDLFCMNDNRAGGTVYNGRPHIEIWFRVTKAWWMHDGSSTTRENLHRAPFFRSIYTRNLKTFYERKGIRNVIFNVFVLHTLASTYTTPCAERLTSTMARSSSAFPQFIIWLWSNYREIFRNFSQISETLSYSRQRSLYNYIEAKIRIYIYRKKRFINFHSTIPAFTI